MRKNTIKYKVLKYWQDHGRVCSYTDLFEAYYHASGYLLAQGGGRPFRVPGANRDYIGMNLLRILKEFGKKTGAPGTRTPWVLQKEID